MVSGAKKFMIRSSPHLSYLRDQIIVELNDPRCGLAAEPPTRGEKMIEVPSEIKVRS